MNILNLQAGRGLSQRSGQLVLPSGVTVRYGGDWSRSGEFMSLSILFSR